jgi:hypothetical protein
MLSLATEYTDVSKFSKDSYGYLKTPPPQIKAVPRKQLPGSDMEELARLREMSDAQLGQHRLPDQDLFKDVERQIGRAMHSSELVRLVKKANPKLIVEDSVNCRGNAAFYFFTPEGEKKPTNAHFKKGILTEWSVIETDAADLPVKVQYGWREILLRLVKARQLSAEQILRIADDSNAVQSTNWRRDLQKFRR